MLPVNAKSNSNTQERPRGNNSVNHSAAKAEKHSVNFSVCGAHVFPSRGPISLIAEGDKKVHSQMPTQLAPE